MYVLASIQPHLAWQYLGLFAASAAFEYAYVAWAKSCSQGARWRVTAWSVAVAALGLLGVGGALTLPYGYIPYLCGIAAGSYTAARR